MMIGFNYFLHPKSFSRPGHTYHSLSHALCKCPFDRLCILPSPPNFNFALLDQENPLASFIALPVDPGIPYVVPLLDIVRNGKELTRNANLGE
jgi:hypothetical protein